MSRWMLVLFFAVGALDSVALDPRANVERAIELIGAGQHSLGRSYLEPALIDPRLSPGERSRAYYLRGFSFSVEGLAVSARKDFNRALEFNPENPAVLFALGWLHYYGQGTPVDHALAVSLFEEGARLGNKQAKFQLAYAYLNGEGVPKNVEHARELLTEEAELGDTQFMMQLAQSYRPSAVDEPAPERAKEWYERAIAAGEPKAYLSLGYMFGNGELGERDVGKGITNYRLAAQSGVAAAYVPLGHAYLTGFGVEQDYAEARAWYEKGAVAGIPDSFTGLGHIYQAGLGVEPDLAKAREWYENGATRGDLNAQLRLTYLLLGEEDPATHAEAIKWLKRAVEQDSAQAHNDYAWLLATSKRDDLRNGTLAISHAKQAVGQEKNAAYLDTLAAAYAENGEFATAIETQLEALKLVEDDQSRLREELETHLQRYERSEPWRE